ncbi:DUF542 domain-containing protein [Microaerobacter geothermalis]|uniref:DUF542 domain-containing protein n=1 Tax=Microaerobacter geothermalis TaxID=674972 RepID=UPI001F4045AC|nr:DUF542 domain-containing protein [Microaerobacter geothermalis]MCF6093137.1 DUF542 domain-containing protein [Microaerobacter geothermalis]
MNITKETVINDIIEANSNAMALLNQFNIDTCCGTFNTLEQGAKQANADVEEVIKKLKEIF